MSKPSLLYASPFPPMASGIADYSVMMVSALDRWFDITLYSDDYDLSDQSLKQYRVVKHGIDEIQFEKYDFLLYNMGNNADFHSYIYEAALSHPGVIIEHDLVLFHFFFSYYAKKSMLYSKLYELYDFETFVDVKRAIKTESLDDVFAVRHPMNEELIRSGNKFLVHSEYTRNELLKTGGIDEYDVRKINLIAQMSEGAEFVDKKKLFAKYNIPEATTLICSFGYIQNTKMNREIAKAVKKIAKEMTESICYVMVGTGDYTDDELEEGRVIKTGYTELDEFHSFIKYADVIANLRYPTMGESSGALLRILQLGKACIVSDVGWFSELPDNCVRKIAVDGVEDELERELKMLLKDNALRTEIGSNAMRYVEEECSPEKIGREVCEFLMNKKA